MQSREGDASPTADESNAGPARLPPGGDCGTRPTTAPLLLGADAEQVVVRPQVQASAGHGGCRQDSFAQGVGLSYFPFQVDNICLSTTRTTITRPTATGSNVHQLQLQRAR